MRTLIPYVNDDWNAVINSGLFDFTSGDTHILFYTAILQFFNHLHSSETTESMDHSRNDGIIGIYNHITRSEHRRDSNIMSPTAEGTRPDAYCLFGRQPPTLIIEEKASSGMTNLCRRELYNKMRWPPHYKEIPNINVVLICGNVFEFGLYGKSGYSPLAQLSLERAGPSVGNRPSFDLNNIMR